MKAPDKIYVEVCEDGIFAFPEPPFAESVEYIRADIGKQPVEGLDSEIDACWQNWLSPSNQKEAEGVLPKNEFAMYARHFAEWQKKRDDLETADLLAIAHLQGMEQQKEKMLEDAVDGFVGVHLHEKRADVTVNTGYLPKEMGIKADSKVKVIIVKED